jgi:hypothetical protein
VSTTGAPATSSRRPGAGPVFTAIFIGLILAACSAAPLEVGAGPQASAAQTPVAESAGPITYPSDNMWAFLASTPGLQRQTDSLAEAVDFSDLIVVGRYVGVERGGQYGEDATAVALIAVDSVAKGVPKLGPDGVLRVEFVLVVGSPTYPEKEFADLQRSIPQDPALLYLSTWETYLMSLTQQFPGWSARKDLASIYKTIGGDGAMRIINGRMAPPSYVDGWPAALRGAEIQTVLDAIGAPTVP